MTGPGARAVVVGDRIRIQRPEILAGKFAEVTAIVQGFEDGGAVIEVRLEDGQQGVLVMPMDAFEFVDRKGEGE